MKRYKIKFTDCGEAGEEIFRGCNAQHAEERFADQMEREGGMEGIRIVSVTLIKQHPPVPLYEK